MSSKEASPFDGKKVAAGLPTGLQITGRHHADFATLQLAHAFEQATGFWRRRPEVAMA